MYYYNPGIWAFEGKIPLLVVCMISLESPDIEPPTTYISCHDYEIITGCELVRTKPTDFKNPSQSKFFLAYESILCSLVT